MQSIRGWFVAVAAFAALVGAPRSADAHWCDDLWGSSFNISVRPETDTVTVPATGSIDLNVWVQNNMGYPLKNFNLTASVTGGYTVDVSRQVPTVANYLMPGERLRYTLAIAKDGGAELSVESIEFFISFGDGEQSRLYGNGAAPVMIRKTDGSLYPPVDNGLIGGNPQALHLRYAAQADYGSLGTALDGLMQEYCSGRRSWDHSSQAVVTTYCPDTVTTSCSSASVAVGTKWDWQKIWAVHELAYRRSALGSRAPVLRARLQCGFDDPHATFRAMPLFALGYLGEDAGARAFLENLIASGGADDAAMAKAALLLMGDEADYTAYSADVRAALGSGTFQVSEVAAAVLGIIDGDDDVVRDHLLSRARWYCGGDCASADDGEGFLAAHLVSIVAWHRRGWAAGANETGTVSFYGEEDAPAPPGAPNCSAATVEPQSGIAPLSVTLDASGCTDPDGDTLTYMWRVSTGTTSEEVYDTALADHLFDEPGNYGVRLVVRDDAATPSETTREFFVTVMPVDGGDPGDPGGGAGGEEGDLVVGSCGCRTSHGAGGGWALALLAAVAVLRRRRR